MMKTTEVLSKGALNELHLSQLVDQMDPAIGEATSVMGAMATEVIRRSLRGGVLQIGRELSGFVGEQVALQIVEQQPLIEKAAAETATEVARGEVEAVRRAARELGQQLADRIDEASREAREKAEVIVRELSGRLEETAKEAQGLALDLSGRLESATRLTEAIKGELSVRIEDAARHADEAATSLARTLETEVGAVETRTLDTARKEFKQQIEEVRDRARRATTQIKERLDRLDLASAQLPDLHLALKRELLDAMRGDRLRLLEEMEDLRRGNDALVSRIEVLERPRGIRGLFAWLFGRNKKKRAEEGDDSSAEEVERKDRD